MDTEFIDALASSSPTPGGGGASAYVAAVASALASMVGELTVGKRKYADVEAEIIGCLGRLSVLRSRLLQLIDEDANAFAPMAAAYAMPKDTPEQQAAKDEALQASLWDACQPPLAIMRACIDVLAECRFLADNGSRLAISDAGACAIIAKAACEAASLNVFINANSMNDKMLAKSLRRQANQLIEWADKSASQIYDTVKSQIGA